MERLVGYRFHPTDEELVDFYLTNKIMGNNIWLVHQAISEIEICEFDPWDLPSKSKISSKDPVWYFFSPRDNTNPKKRGTKRTTKSGYWKATGVDRKIKRKGNSGEIGVKKTLVFYNGRVPKGLRTPYVMHEYHATALSTDQKTYVICKVKYKGEDVDTPSGNGSEASRSLVSNSHDVEMNTGSEFNFQGHQQVQETPESFYGISENDLVMQLNDQTGLSLWEVENSDKLGNNPNVQLQTPYWTQNENELHTSLMLLNQEDMDYLFADQEQATYRHMQENYNDYKPQKALTGVYVDSSSDSDAESVSAKSYQETLSPVDTVGSSNGHHYTDLDSSQMEEIRSLGHKELGTTRDSSVSGKARIGAQGQPKGVRLLGKYQCAIPLKPEVSKVTENKKTSALINRGKGGYLELHSGVEESDKYPPPYVYLSNTIIGIILLVALFFEIISVATKV